MAFAAVLFALPFALASAALLSMLNGLSIEEAALVYVLAGLGSMGALLVTAKTEAPSRF